MSQNLSKDNSVQFWYTIWRLVIIGNLISTRQKIDGHITSVGWGSQFVFGEHTNRVINFKAFLKKL